MPAFTLQTSYSGFYVISPDSITKHTINSKETSQGILVKKHYKAVLTALQILVFVCGDKVYESVSDFWHEEKNLKDAPHLETVLDALEEQLNTITGSVYGSDTYDHFKYSDELRHIRWEIDSLKSGRYYEADNPRFGHQRGIPRISTVGKRLCDQVMDLVWKMDNNAPNRLEEIAEAVSKVHSPFDDIYPEVRPEKEEA